jgi:hypothetical protein
VLNDLRGQRVSLSAVFVHSTNICSDFSTDVSAEDTAVEHTTALLSSQSRCAREERSERQRVKSCGRWKTRIREEV